MSTSVPLVKNLQVMYTIYNYQINNRTPEKLQIFDIKGHSFMTSTKKESGKSQKFDLFCGCLRAVFQVCVCRGQGGGGEWGWGCCRTKLDGCLCVGREVLQF